MQEPSGGWGGNLVFSTSSAGSSSTALSGQLTDRLILDAQGLATFTGSVTLSSTASSLTVLGSTALGATATQTLTVNATSSFTAAAFFTAVTATGNVLLSNTASSLTVLGSTALGATAAQTLVVNATSNFTSAATFAALTASGNVFLNGGSSQSLTVQATSSFSAPVTVSSNLTVNGFTNLTNGVALTNPVTIDKRPVLRIAVTANYTDLVAQPRAYAASTPFSATAGAAIQPANMSAWYGTVSVTGSRGVASAYPTADGTVTGLALFSSILSVSATAYVPTASNAAQIPTAAVIAISADMRNVTLTAVQGTSLSSTLSTGVLTTSYAPAGTLIMCTILGTYST